MSYFRNMDQPESFDITQHPGYAALPEPKRKEVVERYNTVFNSNHGRMGIKIAQGIAYEAAKQVCESFIAEKGPDWGVHQQAAVPKAHPIADTGKYDGMIHAPADEKVLDASPEHSLEPPHAHSTDPQDGNSKGMQAKNVEEKCPKCTAFPCVCPPGPVKEDEILEDEIHEAYHEIGPGDHVTIKSPQGQNHKGKVVMKGSHGWVLNMGGKHGTPGIATEKNYVSHRKAAKKKDGAGGALIRSMNKEEVDPLISAAAGYLTMRKDVRGIVESVEK